MTIFKNKMNEIQIQKQNETTSKVIEQAPAAMRQALNTYESHDTEN